MTIQSDLALAFQLFEEEKFNHSKALYEEILEKELTLDEEIQLRYGYGYPLSALGLVKEAIENYAELKIIGKENLDNDIISQALHQQGMVLWQNGVYNCAHEIFLKERAFIEEHFKKNKLYKAANYYELGYVNLLLGNLKEAYPFLKHSLAEAKQTKDLIMIACSLRGLGEYYIKQNNRAEAVWYLEDSIQNFEAASDSRGVYEVKQIIQTIIH